MPGWIDTHCHLDAEEFSLVGQTAGAPTAFKEVVHCVIAAVEVANFASVRSLAQRRRASYCLGIHPLYVASAPDTALAALEAALQRYHADPRLVAVGEIGLDFFLPQLRITPLRERQEYFYHEQLKLARRFDLPVVLHSRRAVDTLLKGLRGVSRAPGTWRGIAHAFNGSLPQAQSLLALGLKLGFGGAVTYARASHLRWLAQTLPLAALVLETDAPDMPPHWLYKTAAQRAAGLAQGINSPAELPRIGAELAALRGLSASDLAQATTCNALTALPRLGALLAALQD